MKRNYAMTYEKQRCEVRHDVSMLDVLCFVRHVAMRTTTFEMKAIDISSGGLRLKDPSRIALVYGEKAKISVTLDIGHAIFPRPICAIYEIRSAFIGELGEKFYGLALVSVDLWHRVAYDEGIGALFSAQKK